MHSQPASPSITHQPTDRRFETRVEGALCSLDYYVTGTRMAIVHTGVPEAVAGRGIASALTRAAVDEARRQGWKISPQCSYAAAWVERHPEVQDLLA